MQEQYIEVKYNNNINKENIEIAVGLGLVDNLKPSKYFYEVLEKSNTYTELENSNMANSPISRGQYSHNSSICHKIRV